MKCKQVRNKLSGFLGGHAPEKDRAEIQHHLESCSNCRTYASELKHVDDEFSLIEDVAVRPYFLTRVKQRIADQSVSRQTQGLLGRVFPRAVIPLGAVAVLVMTALAGGQLGKVVYNWKMQAAISSIKSERTGGGEQKMLDGMPGSSLAAICDGLFPGGDHE
jgi:anti-sigma factor RsiW